MKHTTSFAPLAALALLTAITACADSANVSEEELADSEATERPETAPPAVADDDGGGETPDAAGGEGETGTPAITLAGYDTIALGKAPSAAKGYALTDDGSFEDACRIYAVPELSDVYAIVQNGTVMRITVSEGSAIETARGIGVGDSEAAVRKAYATLGEQGHAYVGPPAKYLTWSPDGNAAGLRFEIGREGKVTHIHSGLAPVLGYVEGCA